MKKTKILVAFLMLAGTFSACKKEQEEPEAVKPTADHIEIGYANNKQAIRGRDFHFNADVTAALRISAVSVKILQKAGQTYSASWKMELDWAEFKGVKNTTVHKHFTIPAEAPEGTYEFIFTVNDENGTKLELKEDLAIIDAANMPVDPMVDRDIFSRNDDMVYYMNTYVENPLLFKKGDKFTARAQVKQIQGDGILYTALIKRKLNYFPETVAQLDMAKATIISKTEHTGLGPASKVNTQKQINGVWGGDDIVIGAEKDVLGNAITGNKAWESGQYNLVILYFNSTYKVSTHKTIPVTINY
ncbi:DUF4625 domain-containing protein [Pedobacter sp. Leaf176]|uniref:DUF4625 domain-containing protein n=1 Tax=Pedobacter sp. Leaf176 TaxID=1736286 RepID=UPI0006F5EC4E|nr:DUF4625 domain-containing protein [Pedobacter sp. Leaf176]KQR67493.1 hypothetical protein ASF92_17560 [Pedobacter sp. Leaf176]